MLMRRGRSSVAALINAITKHLLAIFTQTYSPIGRRKTHQHPATQMPRLTLIFSRDVALLLSNGKASYTQEVFKDFYSDFTCPSVRFNITSEGQTLGYWERLIEPAANIKKARVQTGFKFKGHAWLPPKLHLQHGIWPYVKELWITERHL